MKVIPATHAALIFVKPDKSQHWTKMSLGIVPTLYAALSLRNT